MSNLHPKYTIFYNCNIIHLLFSVQKKSFISTRSGKRCCQDESVENMKNFIVLLNLVRSYHVKTIARDLCLLYCVKWIPKYRLQVF